MGYDIHVERRRGQPHITLAEWLAALATAPSARILTSDVELGPGMTIAPNPGDTELYFADEDRWQLVFRCTELRSGKAYIRTRATALGRPEVLAFLRHVTAALDAIVKGDGGEEYDLATGDPVDLDPKYRR